ncbi:tRNA epoxyqueuosine(34) reductase QueG [Candidatus Peregrinibacteria bacterium]|nr:tRNA epoxyqueuosine(34) reductase QueG [Candidatus Peregrinibacteria bacterium]
MQKFQQKIKKYALEQGFDLVGFTKAKIESKYIKAYKTWLKNGHQASMKWMEKSKPREDFTKILPRAKSVIVLGINYYNPQKPLKKDHARVARYACGRDYHKIIGKKLKTIETFIRNLIKSHPDFTQIQTKSYVDTGPILERALAEQAGLGTIGKNSCFITKEYGSWVFLAEIITNLDLYNDKAEKHQNQPENINPHPLCGRCIRCIDACPTGAIIAPGVIDSRKCISYQTIENKGKIPKKLAKKIKNSKYIFGCDICQKVCPQNIAKQQITSHKELNHPKIAGDQIPLKKILSLKSEKEFTEKFAGSPLMRAKLKGLKRTAKILT